jgi:hypothetical protein
VSGGLTQPVELALQHVAFAEVAAAVGVLELAFGLVGVTEPEEQFAADAREGWEPDSAPPATRPSTSGG